MCRSGFCVVPFLDEKSNATCCVLEKQMATAQFRTLQSMVSKLLNDNPHDALHKLMQHVADCKFRCVNTTEEFSRIMRMLNGARLDMHEKLQFVQLLIENMSNIDEQFAPNLARIQSVPGLFHLLGAPNSGELVFFIIEVLNSCTTRCVATEEQFEQLQWSFKNLVVSELICDHHKLQLDEALADNMQLPPPQIPERFQEKPKRTKRMIDLFDGFFTSDEHKHLLALIINDKINASKVCCMDSEELDDAMEIMTAAELLPEDKYMITRSLQLNLSRSVSEHEAQLETKQCEERELHKVEHPPVTIEAARFLVLDSMVSNIIGINAQEAFHIVMKHVAGCKYRCVQTTEQFRKLMHTLSSSCLAMVNQLQLARLLITNMCQLHTSELDEASLANLARCQSIPGLFHLLAGQKSAELVAFIVDVISSCTTRCVQTEDDLERLHYFIAISSLSDAHKVEIKEALASNMRLLPNKVQEFKDEPRRTERIIDLFAGLFTYSDHKHFLALTINDKINASKECCMTPDEYEDALKIMTAAMVSREDHLMLTRSLKKNKRSEAEPVHASAGQLKVLEILAKAFMKQEQMKVPEERDYDPIFAIFRR